MKRLLITGVLVGLAASSFAASRSGLAQAKSEFSITRDGAALIQSSGRVSEVRTGDVIQSTAEAVSVESANGTAFMVGPESHVTVGKKQQVVLENGTVALSSVPGQQLSAEFRNLTFVPAALSNGSELERSIYVLKSQPGNSVVIQAAENSVAVKNTETGEQLAWVAPGDTVMLVPDGETWRVTALGQGAPYNMFRAQVQESTAEVESAADDDDDDRAGWWWWAGAGVGAAALGAALWYEDEDDDDDNKRDRKNRKDDDEDRGNTSVIAPPLELAR